jgi:hypothetical protein
VKVVKNKCAPPFRKAEFDILYGEGISRESDIIDLGLEQGLVVKAGAWFSAGETRIGQGKENARKFLKDNPDLALQLETAIRATAGLPPAFPSGAPAPPSNRAAGAPGDGAAGKATGRGASKPADGTAGQAVDTPTTAAADGASGTTDGASNDDKGVRTASATPPPSGGNSCPDPKPPPRVRRGPEDPLGGAFPASVGPATNATKRGLRRVDTSRGPCDHPPPSPR